MTDDIDSLRQRIQALEKTAADYARLESLIEAAAQGQSLARFAEASVLYVDPASQRLVDASDAALELLGYSRAALLSLSIFDIETPTEDTTTAARTVGEIFIQEQVYASFYTHRLGYTLPMHVYRRLLYRGGGEVMAFHLEEKSLYKQVLHELQRREGDGFTFGQKLKALGEIIIELSRLDSVDALCYHAVRLGIERLGFDRIGMWFLDAENRFMIGSYGVDEQGAIRPEHDKRWRYGGTYIMDFIAGKTEASFAYDGAPIFNEKSELIHYGWHISAPMLHGDQFIGVLTSDNFLRGEPMKPYEPELLHQYGIALGYLTQLARARDQAFAIRLEQERARMLRQFISSVGHDFRTPLSVINTKIYLIQRVPTPEQRKLLADGIQEQVTYIGSILDSILKFIELENEVTLTLTPIDLHALLVEVIASHRDLYDEKRIVCAITPPDALPIAADREYLRRALSEILLNALQYTPDGGRVQVSLVRYSGEIGIRIQDSGVGIAQDALDKVFTPLYRVDEARTERRIGLGLAIARSIVEAHHGRITVESVLGDGSTFEVILPQS